ncbi:protein tfg-1-like [Palaemon carinicauda]|uniref:protein tfg-1-like n=1 Tax=Palaemon carinicauda TaxID=392227 RepID=UPI0035B59110
MMQSGDEGDDELTSLEGESLKRRTPLPKIRENLPGPESGRDDGHGERGLGGRAAVAGGEGGGGVSVGRGGGMVGGARGPSSRRGSSPGLRVTWDERSTQPPLLHQFPHQPLLLQQHHFLPSPPPQHQQQQTQSGTTAAAGPPASGVVGSGGSYLTPTHTAPPAPSSPAHPDSQPKKVTVTSFNQPKLRPVVTQHSGPPTPVLEERKRPPSPVKPQPLAPEENPPPSAPPQDLVYADSDKRREQWGRPHPHNFPPRRTAATTSTPTDEYKAESERGKATREDILRFMWLL